MIDQGSGTAERAREELFTSFGSAEIVQQSNGTLEIRGGTEEERTQAHDWMRRFLTRAPLTLRRLA